MTPAFIYSAVLIAWAGYLAIWARSGPTRLAGVVLVLAMLPSALVVEYFTLGQPKTLEMEWFKREARNVSVLGFKVVEDEAIYLLLDVPGDDRPTYYEMPYSDKAAEELESAAQEAQEEGTGIVMGMPFERSLENRDQPMFYTPPQPKLPDKPQPPAPEVFEQPA